MSNFSHQSTVFPGVKVRVAASSSSPLAGRLAYVDGYVVDGAVRVREARATRDAAGVLRTGVDNGLLVSELSVIDG